MLDRQLGERAVVVGAGIGGLAAAAALADVFATVTVLDRDDLPDAPVPRSGVPQSRHLHMLLASGLKALGELFPDIEQDIIAAGAVPMRAGLDLRYEFPDLHPFPQRDLGWTGLSVSRPVLEHTVRHALLRRPNVEIRPRSRVVELLADADGAAVTGVRVADGEGGSVPADLVVDASGRGALTLALLQSLGRPAPEESAIGVDIRYATAQFAMPADPPAGWKGVLIPVDPRGSRRAGALFPVEGHRWMVVLAGVHGDTPPADRDGFRGFAATLHTKTIFEAIRDLEPVVPIERYGLPASVRRYFDRLAFFPRGLLTTGDGLCLFNPIYGQGMSVAAQQGKLLRRMLDRLGADETLAGLAPAFFAKAQTLADTPWWNAAVPDLVHPETTGERPPNFADALQYGAALRRLAAEDADVYRLLLEVQHLLKPRSALGDPALVARVRAAMGAPQRAG